MKNLLNFQGSLAYCFSAKNCTDPPFPALGDDKGMSDWNNVSQSYGTKIKYYCPKAGWGFPSNGLSEVFNECQADKTWTLDEVDTCVCKIKLKHGVFVSIFTMISYSVTMSKTCTAQTNGWLVLVWIRKCKVQMSQWIPI